MEISGKLKLEFQTAYVTFEIIEENKIVVKKYFCTILNKEIKNMDTESNKATINFLTEKLKEFANKNDLNLWSY